MTVCGVVKMDDNLINKTIRNNFSTTKRQKIHSKYEAKEIFAEIQRGL